jgi:hypothetical protein
MCVHTTMHRSNAHNRLSALLAASVRELAKLKSQKYSKVVSTHRLFRPKTLYCWLCAHRLQCATRSMRSMWCDTEFRTCDMNDSITAHAGARGLQTSRICMFPRAVIWDGALCFESVIKPTMPACLRACLPACLFVRA